MKSHCRGSEACGAVKLDVLKQVFFSEPFCVTGGRPQSGLWLEGNV